MVEDITADGNAVMHNVTRTEKDEDGNKVEVTETVPFVENKKIMQPFGDRSKVVIEPMLTDQWFVDAEKVVGPALDAVKEGRTKIVPESGEKVYYHWLENIEPWCISRQLWWGHQIPVWYGPLIRKDTETGKYWTDYTSKKSFCASTEDEVQKKIESYYEGSGYDIRFVDVSKKPLDDYILDDTDLEKDICIYRDPDVLDTWFSSGLWPFGTLGWPEETDELAKYFPGDVLVTGQDILFFWVARMMMMSEAVMDDIPFHTVYLHQLVRDEKGRKMSKTTGNVIDPLDMIDAYGADALRFSNAQMAAMGGVLKISEDRIKGYRNFGTKLWNACRFAEMNEVFSHRANLPDASPTQVRRKSDAQFTVNKWIVGETTKTLAVVNDALETYRFNDAANALYSFVWGKVCDWYVELSKPLLLDGNETEKSDTQTTMAWVLDQCMIMLHPIMPFITEELWQTLGDRNQMLIHTDWPTYQATDLVDELADQEMNWVIDLIDNIRSARAQVHVPAGAKVPLLVTGLDAKGQAAWDNNQAMIQKLARVESLEAVTDFPKGCVTIPMDGGTFGIPLADLIDVAEEIARLEKSIQKLGKELGGLRGRLNNPKFAASAPAEVVAEAQENLRLREGEEAELKAAIQRLQEIG